MSFLTIFGALLLEFLRPLTSPDAPRMLFQRLAGVLENSLNAGERFHGALAWLLVVAPAIVIAAVVHSALAGVGWLLAFAWDMAVLYLCMGFKHDTHVAASVARALREGDTARAGEFAGEIGVTGDPARVTAALAGPVVEALFDRAQRHVFGVIAWFVILSPFGPVGALLYRAADALADAWGTADLPAPFGDFARTAQHVLRWLPARLSAASYAVAGNFEDAMVGWRSRGPDAGPRDIVVGAAAGALGIRLGAVDTGTDAEADDIESAVGLIWRAVLIWLAVGCLFALGGWLNG